MAYKKRITALCSGFFGGNTYIAGDDISWIAEGGHLSEENLIANGLGKVEYTPLDTGNYREVVFALVGGFSGGKIYEAGDDISFLTNAAEGREAIPASRLVETGLARIGYVEIPLAAETKKKEPKANVGTDI